MHTTRRTFLNALLGTMATASLGVALRPSSAKASLPEVVTYKSPSCGCCGAWVKRMEAAGFTVKVIEIPDVEPIKTRLGIPVDLQSCHTSEVGGYAVEGHVPPSSIKRLLAERPSAVGISVPGMPSGSPGMETGHKETYPVVLIGRNSAPAIWEWH